jgi:hypothetical protein
MLEVIRFRWSILDPGLRVYMPKHWSATKPLPQKLTLHRNVLLLLVLASPALFRRPRVDPLCGLALCIVVSGVVGSFAAYYGDAIELVRHCYGCGQQVVFGLVLGLLAYLDRRGRGERHPPQPDAERASS